MRGLENRIPPLVVAVLSGLLMWAVARYAPGIGWTMAWRLPVAIALLLAGVATCVAGVVSFRRARTTVNPVKLEAASALVVSGIYQYSRNPMYLGFALALLAWSVVLSSAVALLGVAGFVLYMNRYQIAPEERMLAGLFGDDYARYRARVRRWI